MSKPITILVAGMAGASLGTEVIKCLKASPMNYRILGADISPHAYGHFVENVESFTVKPDDYLADIKKICSTQGVKFLIPGGEVPLSLLSPHSKELKASGTYLLANDPSVVAACSDKAIFTSHLEKIGLPSPQTTSIAPGSERSIPADFPFPCIVKPATGTGGSAFVSLVGDIDEARAAIAVIHNMNITALIQEYLPLDEGEYTIGVLHLPDGTHASTIMLRRIFNSKLSVSFAGQHGLISSGYSQGYIGEFPLLAAQAERLAESLGSRGPLNIQARVKNGILYPFEANPRFSASTYLRCMAGFNEIDVFMRCGYLGAPIPECLIKPGYYLRSFDEIYVPSETM